MQSRSIAPSHEPVLLLDPHADTAADLAAQLESCGFPTCVETDAAGARAAMERTHFATLIVAADVDDPVHLRWLDQLRRGAARSWIVVISARCDAKTCNLIHRHSGDACIAAPVSIHELVRCLTAFQLRDRPVL